MSIPSVSSSTSGGAPIDGAAVPGKLKDIAVELFERAYGLHGRKVEDHEALQTEAIRRTGCSPKAFQELIFGHSYPQMLGQLRLSVKGYKPKQPRQRTPSERGTRGSISSITPFVPHAHGYTAGIEGFPTHDNKMSTSSPSSQHIAATAGGGGGSGGNGNGNGGMMDGSPASPSSVINHRAPIGSSATNNRSSSFGGNEWPRRDMIGGNGAPSITASGQSAIGTNMRGSPSSQHSRTMIPSHATNTATRGNHTGYAPNAGGGGGAYRDISLHHGTHGTNSSGSSSNDSSPILTPLNAPLLPSSSSSHGNHASSNHMATSALPPANRYQPAPATSAAYHSYAPYASHGGHHINGAKSAPHAPNANNSNNNNASSTSGGPSSSSSYHASNNQPIGSRSHQMKSPGAVPSAGFAPFAGHTTNNNNDTLLSSSNVRFTSANSSLLSNHNSNTITGSASSHHNGNGNGGGSAAGSNPGSASSSPSLFPSLVNHNNSITSLQHLQLPGQAISSPLQAESPHLSPSSPSPRSLRSILNMGTMSLERQTPSPLPIFGRDHIDASLSAAANINSDSHDNGNASSSSGDKPSSSDTITGTSVVTSANNDDKSNNDDTHSDHNDTIDGDDLDDNTDDHNDDAASAIASATTTDNHVTATDGDDHDDTNHIETTATKSIDDTKRDTIAPIINTTNNVNDHHEHTAPSTSSSSALSTDSVSSSSPVLASPSVSLDRSILSRVTHDQRFIKAFVFAICFSLVRGYLHYINLYISIASVYVTSLLTCVIIACMIPLSMLFYSSYRTYTNVAELPSLLAASVECYTESWEFLAVEDQAQLLAALHQIKLLLDSLIATLSGDTTAFTNSVKTLDFLHAAHKNLISDLGSTPLVSQLIATLRVIRELLLRHHFPAATSLQHIIVHITAATMIPLAIILFVGGDSTSATGEMLIAIAISFVTPILLLTIIDMCNVSLSGGNGSALVSVSLSPLLYLRSRLLDKEREVLLPRAAASSHSSHSHSSSHEMHDTSSPMHHDARDFDAS